MSELFDIHPLVVDKDIATALGLNEAIVLQQVHYWIEINKKHKRNCHKGRYWTYNTIEEWREEFPFWSTSTVKRTFKRLRDRKIVIVDNFNTYQMDRTLWYTIDYEELEKIMEKSLDSKEDQNNTMKGSKEIVEDNQNDTMEESKKNPAIPETSTEITPEISNQSISQSIEKDENIKRDMKKDTKKERQIDRQTTQQKKINLDYETIIKRCELYAIDEKYRDAVAHAIKLLLFDIKKSKWIKIGDNYISAETVEKDINKLNFFTVEHAVNKFKEASKSMRIRNPIAYLKVCIYNSINEMAVDIDSKLRYEGLID
ncbi:hypothetical protein FYJ27_11885 [Anaerosalibacter bizertensis]|uniref:Uncharacterized protein n=1 Tax=Anaerosalibacter bizertensis TaxID=932217 RepID=A0A844FKN4_9FIRM|nr:hypothetical protein [Anaerosalibacter bizertensis]MSS44395.1 hypothetical protein [Anaerosalibacter bizertensis]